MKPTAIFLTILICCASSFCFAGEKLKIATGEWPPYTSRKMEDKGMASQIVTRVFEKMGRDIDIVFYPWPRCFNSVMHGKVLAAFPYAPTEERKKKMLYSSPILFSTARLFYYGKQDKPFNFETFQDLKDYRIGGIKGYFYDSLFKKKGIVLDYAPEIKNGLEKLMLGRTDLFVSNELVAWYYIHKNMPDERDQFATLDKILDTNTLHLIFTKNCPDSNKWLLRFNEALEDVKNEYFYETMINNLNRFRSKCRE